MTVPIANLDHIESRQQIVHVVDDDESSRRAIARLLRVAGYSVDTYRDASAFFEDLPADVPGCVLLDLEMPGSSGLEVQQALARAGSVLSVVFFTGYGDVPTSVRAMRAGAVDFLVKSVGADVLLEAVARAAARSRVAWHARARRLELASRYERLSPREREVLAHLISGQLNKQVGFDLGISEQTTKIHRHRIFEKMCADSIPSLVRMARDLGITPVGSVR
jgi:FixJ family two-component response regulator